MNEGRSTKEGKDAYRIDSFRFGTSGLTRRDKLLMVRPNERRLTSRVPKEESTPNVSPTELRDQLVAP